MQTTHPEIIPLACTPAEIALLSLIRNENITFLTKSLLSIHDMAVYHSTVSIGQTERMQLLYVRLLADALEEIEKEG